MDLEEIKRRKLEELIRRQQVVDDEEARMLQQIQLVEEFAKKYLSKEALVRYSNLKSAHPEKAVQATAIIVQLVNSGRIKNKLDDVRFKALLQEMEQPKKEFKIRRK